MAAGHHLRDRRPRLQIANATYVGTVEFAKTVSDLVADSVLSAICDGRNAPKADDDMAEKLLKDVGEINVGIPYVPYFNQTSRRPDKMFEMSLLSRILKCSSHNTYTFHLANFIKRNYSF